MAPDQEIFDVVAKARRQFTRTENLLRRRGVCRDRSASPLPRGRSVRGVERKGTVEGLAVAALIIELARHCRVEPEERTRDDDGDEAGHETVHPLAPRPGQQDERCDEDGGW